MRMPPTELVLDAGEVHVWWIDLPQVDTGVDLLSADEWGRAARLHRARDRERWVAARVALRQILAGYLGRAPAELPIGRDPFGKPVLAGEPSLRFNLSHAGERAALAVALARDIGIDLEARAAVREDDADLGRLIAVTCAPAEARRLARLLLPERVDAFLALWTLKEAYLKALGAGLARDPRSVEIAIGADGRITLGDTSASRRETSCRLRRLDAGPGWVAALAVTGSETAVRERAWP